MIGKKTNAKKLLRVLREVRPGSPSSRNNARPPSRGQGQGPLPFRGRIVHEICRGSYSTWYRGRSSLRFFCFFFVCVCVRSGLSSPLPSVFGPGVCFALGRKNFIGPLFFFLRRETSQPNRTALHRTEQQPLVGHGAGLPPFLAA